MPIFDNSKGWQLVTPASVVTPRLWKTIPSNRVDKIRGYIILPAFSLSIPLTTYPRLVAQFNYETDKAFSFETKLKLSSSYGFMVCVSWRRGLEKARFQFWSDPTYNQLVYQHDIIHRYFSLEIWSYGQTSLTLPAAIQFQTSQRYINTAALYAASQTAVAVANAVASSDLQLLLTDEGGGEYSVPWDTAIPAGLRWTDNVGTWNELTAGSERRASEIFPGSFA